MRYTLLFFILVLFAACKSSTDKTIDQYGKKVDELSEKAGNTNINDPSVQALEEDINALIDELAAKDLSDEQQATVTGISLRLQVAIQEMAEKSAEQMQDNMEEIQNNLDSIGAQMQQFDTSNLIIK